MKQGHFRDGPQDEDTSIFMICHLIICKKKEKSLVSDIKLLIRYVIIKSLADDDHFLSAVEQVYTRERSEVQHMTHVTSWGNQSCFISQVNH